MAMQASVFDLAPWRFLKEASAEERLAQQALQTELSSTGRIIFGQHCVVSPYAGLDPEQFEFADHCLIAAYAVLAGTIQAGRFCTFNSHAVVRGRISLGEGVRIASHASIIGFEHVQDDLQRPIFQQGIRSHGIEIGNNVWIGAGAIILDGVRIGHHSVIGAGAVVTRDVPDYAVAVGNPARVVRDRRRPRAQDSLQEFGSRVAAEWPAVLARCANAGAAVPYLDRPGAAPSLRGICDAIEIAAMFDAIPASIDRAATVSFLQSTQDPASGIPLDPWHSNAAEAPLAILGDANTRYQILAVGYALECLGASYALPLHAAAALDGPTMTRLLEALPWREQPWNAGAWVDSLATALWFNRRQFGLEGVSANLFDWLAARCMPHTGLWGVGSREQGWLPAVNGFYRLTRGSYAQFGLRVPYPEAAIDTVLAHGRFYEDFVRRGDDACNVLDAMHALWLCSRWTDYRQDDIRRCAGRQIALIVARWAPGKGFAFASGQPVSLRGTELWLAALYTAAAIVGAADRLGYRPRGVHRLPARAGAANRAA